MRGIVSLAILMLGVSEMAGAHQPVMDMAPRWEHGWGFQVRNEYRFSGELLGGTDQAPNPFDRERMVNTTWVESVFTFKREIRLTSKVPLIQQSRVVVQGGAPVNQSGRGLGDTVLGLQLKHYYNKAGSTGNFSITPSLRLPTGSTKDSFPVGDGSWDAGISASFSAEAPFVYQFYDVFYWRNSKGKRGIDQGDEVGFDMNIGIHPYHDNLTNTGIFVMADLSARYEGRGRDTVGPTGGKRISLGPVLVGYWNNIMVRAELKFPIYQDVFGIQLSHGTDFNIGIGLTF